MAARFWVSGDGNFSDNTNHWAATSGGAPGASKPGASDTATWDGNSGGGTCTFDEAVSLTSWTSGAYAGTINTNGQTGTVSGGISISGTATRTITLGASAISCGTWTATTTTNLTFNANTSAITMTGANTFNGGGLTYATVNITGISSASGRNWANPTINGANTFAVLSRAVTSYSPLVLGANQIITTTLTLTGGNDNTQRLWVGSSVLGTQRTITCNGTVTITNVDFEDIVGAGSGSWTGTSIGDCGNNSGITFTSPVTRYWVHGASASYDFFSDGRWSTTSGGSIGATHPLPQDTARFDVNSFPTSGKAVTNNTTRARYPNISWNGATNSPEWVLFSAPPILFYGSVETISGMSMDTDTVYYCGRGSKTWTSGGLSWNSGSNLPVTIDCVTGTLAFADAFTSTTSTPTLTSGTLNTNGVAVTVPRFSAGGSSTRTLLLGSSVITLTGTATVWTTTTTGLTFDPGTSTIKLTNNSTSTKTFSGGGAAFYNYWNATQGTGTVTISGSNTFIDFKVDAGRTQIFTAATTQTVATFTATGGSGTEITLQSTSTTNFILSKTSGFVYGDYLIISDSTAQGGALWFAGLNATDNGGGNSGWIFNTAPIQVNDTVSVAEDISAYIGQRVPLIFDNVTIVENIATFFPTLAFSLFDSVSVAEVTTLYITELFILVIDAVSVAEDVVAESSTIISLVSVFDNASIAEDIILSVPMPVFAFDAVSVAEVLTFTGTDYIFVFDAITVDDVIDEDASGPTLFMDIPEELEKHGVLIV